MFIVDVMKEKIAVREAQRLGIPVFAMVGAEGKLFRPLAFTKTFALLGAFVLGIVVLRL